MLIAKRGIDGIMCPFPAYPLYPAETIKAGGVIIPYYLDEESGWTLNREILEESYDRAKITGINTKALVVGTPHNPASSILNRLVLEEIISFALDHNIPIIADEVYQENTYGEEFISLATVLGARPLGLFSLHSISKGPIGECGKRGGYVEIRNSPKAKNSDLTIRQLLEKDASKSLCSVTTGQILVYLMVLAATPGSQIYSLVKPEKDAILASLKERADIIRGAFSEMQGIRCYGRTAAMYLFPNLGELPAGDTNFSPDFNYCMALLRETGLCTVNGAGFGQKPGTNHLRTTFLPPKKLLENVLPEWIEFHNSYVKGDIK